MFIEIARGSCSQKLPLLRHGLALSWHGRACLWHGRACLWPGLALPWRGLAYGGLDCYDVASLAMALPGLLWRGSDLL